MLVVLVLLYVLCYGLVLVLWFGFVGVGFFVFLIGVLLLVVVVCLWWVCCDCVVLGWWVMVLVLLLWVGGMVFNMIDVLGVGWVDFIFYVSLLLYVLYGVLLVFILVCVCCEWLGISLIDVVMVVLLGVLFFVYIELFVVCIDVDVYVMLNM